MTQTKSYTVKDFYKAYCKNTIDNPVYSVDYKLFREIVVDYFKYLRDEIIENGREVKIPARLGTVQVVKHRPARYTGDTLRIDYGESKKLNKVIYHLNEHTNGFKYRFHWNKSNMLTRNKSFYQLVMTRANKRRLAYILKNRIRDYQET